MERPPPRPPVGRGARGAAASLVFVLIAAACGTRVPEDEVQRLLSAPAEASDGLQAEAGQAPSRSRREASPGGGGGGGGAGSPAQPSAGGGAEAAPGAGGGRKRSGCTSNPGATDVGVTARSVRVGATYAESSLVPGQFRPAIDAIQAYLGSVNRNHGGVCGRTIEFHAHNDGLNAQRYAENVRHLVEQDKVFLLLGSLSAADSGGCGFLRGHRPPRGVPDVGTFALSYCRSQAPNHYSAVGSLRPGIYGCCVDWQWLRKRFGYRKPAVHYLDIEISRDQGQSVVDALVRTLRLRGPQEVERAEHSPAQFSYAGDVQSMQRAGVDGVWSSMDLNNNVKLVRAMCQQEWRPKVVHLEISAYDPALIERVGRDCVAEQNIWIRSFHRAFSARNAEISRYVSALRAYCPRCRPTTFGLEGWLNAKLFVEVLRAAGPELTRQRFYRAMDAVRGWTGGGVMGPMTPSKRLIYHCNVMLHVRPQGFSQERGLQCGKFYRRGDYRGPAVGP